MKHFLQFGIIDILKITSAKWDNMKKWCILLLSLLFLCGCEYPFASGGTPIPVLSRYNESLTINGYYDVTVNNLTDESLDLWFDSPGKGKENFRLPPNGVRTFGSEYGVVAGTYYSIGGEGYSTLSEMVVVP